MDVQAEYENHRHETTKSVLFPGCNFPAYYPKTMKKLAELFETMGIDTVYDCCQKPLAELGRPAKEVHKATEKLESRLERLGVKEVITLCPNCYYFMKERLNLRVVSIYEKLPESCIYMEKLTENDFMYVPCPDRQTMEWNERICTYLPESPQRIKDIPCCGLGGAAFVKNKAVSVQMAKKIEKYRDCNVYTYCASCTGHFLRYGHVHVYHVLTEMLGTHEKPAIYLSKLNRIRAKCGSHRIS